MNKFFKGIFTLATVGAFSYVGFKGYKRISSVFKLGKTLPEYLENIIEEKTKVNITMSLGTVKISVGLTKEALEKNTDIEAHVREYIEDFYPPLSKMKVDISLYELNECEEEEDGDGCCCCCGEEEEPEQPEDKD